MLYASLALLIGLGLLTVGADRMVVAAARLSRAWGLSPILIGALVIGFGTSAPELLVSGLASARGELALAMGNVVGSNVANLSLVLGTAALIAVLWTRLEVLRREGTLMMAAVLAFGLALVDARLTRLEGVLLLAGMVIAGALVVRWSSSDAAQRLRAAEEVAQLTGGEKMSKAEMAVGLAALVATLLGAEFLVRGATGIAEELELSPAVVGLTIVAIGTSLPELATSIAGARRGQTDLVIGNVVGSNLFNSLGVAGVAGVVGPGTIPTSFRISLLMMVVIAAGAGMMVATGRRLVRAEGVVLLLAFVVFLLTV